MANEFSTDRLLLRPYGPDDWPHVHRLWSDPAIIWWRGDDPMTEEETHDLHGRYAGLNGAANSGYGWWLVFERQTGALAGQAALKALPDLPGEIELGWQLAPAYRGKGYAPEAARRLLEHGFTTKALDEIVAVIASGNTASLRVAQRLGMTKSAELMKAGLLHHLFRIGQQQWSRA